MARRNLSMATSPALMAAAFALAVLCPDESLAETAGTVYSSDEVTLRLLREPAKADGSVRGALLVDLAPGWKTYWIDPGASGIPPTIDLSPTSGLEQARIRYPAPHRFGEDLTRANGYKEPVAFAFTLEPKDGETLGTVEASIFLGVCEEICIPVSASLEAGLTTGESAKAVEIAFAALPETRVPNAETFSVAAHPDGDALTVSIAAPSGEAAGIATDVFVTAPGGWYFDEPGEPRTEAGRQIFDVPIVSRPRKTKGAPAAVDVVVTAGASAVEMTEVPVSAGSTPR
ncbi:protein-disulfide reductase DsbD domain-containing protein [Jiella marina]|uniref:protein-disulfide reductase DsbD domain-containing protein n=1 Tax=Jiella sp. LLJ827 TaxID=2917712 RepID=UPI0021012EB8|nr:protein-disulfide reductase DsbD domain-containing protein [Jiella sp. LLJ827]MCQ0987771.1 hypothetical protein [Jiella sp. LLJ827]